MHIMGNHFTISFHHLIHLWYFTRHICPVLSLSCHFVIIICHLHASCSRHLRFAVYEFDCSIVQLVVCVIRWATDLVDKNEIEI